MCSVLNYMNSTVEFINVYYNSTTKTESVEKNAIESYLNLSYIIKKNRGKQFGKLLPSCNCGAFGRLNTMIKKGEIPKFFFLKCVISWINYSRFSDAFHSLTWAVPSFLLILSHLLRRCLLFKLFFIMLSKDVKYIFIYS